MLRSTGINCIQGFDFSSTQLYFIENGIYELSWKKGKFKIPLELQN